MVSRTSKLTKLVCGFPVTIASYQLPPATSKLGRPFSIQVRSETHRKHIQACISRNLPVVAPALVRDSGTTAMDMHRGAAAAMDGEKRKGER